MDLANFLTMRAELGLLAIFVVLLVLDIVWGKGASDDAGQHRAMRWFRPVAVVLLCAHTVWGVFSPSVGEVFGGMYVASGMTGVMKTILGVGTIVVFLQAGEWLRRPENSIREGEFYVLTIATLLGMNLMISAGNFMLLYLGVEIASLPATCLAAYDKHREGSAEAGAKYILLTTLSSGVMMFGLSYLYGATGSMYFADMSPRVAAEGMTILGFVFFLSGLGFKITLVPFHAWAPDVYQGAPTAVTGYLSVVSKGAAVFALVLALHHVFGGLAVVWHHVGWGLAVLTIVVGNLFALRQSDMKRFMAYSSISQAGYILLGMLHGSGEGLSAVVYFVFVYLFSNLAAFGVIGAVENHSGKTAVEDYRGLYGSNPRLALVMMLAVFSLAGIPPLGGFFSKFFVFAAAARGGDWVLLAIALANTVVSLYYYLRVVRAMFIEEPGEDAVGPMRTDGYSRAALVVCVVGILFSGVVSWLFNHISTIGF